MAEYDKRLNELIEKIEDEIITISDSDGLFKKAERILRYVIAGLVEISTKEKKNWQQELIFKKDIEEYNSRFINNDIDPKELNHPNSCILNAKKMQDLFHINPYGSLIEKALYNTVEPISLATLDFAALCKLLKFRLNEIVPKCVSELAKQGSIYRNSKDHDNDENILADNQQLLSIIRKDIELVEKIPKELPESKKICQLGGIKLSCIYNRLDNLINGFSINKNNNEPIMAEQLLTYKIIVDEFALTDKYGHDFINRLERYTKVILVPGGAAKGLSDIHSNPENEGRVRDNARNAIKKLPRKSDRNEDTKFQFFGERTEDSHDQILEFLKDNDVEKKICIITAWGYGDYLAQQVAKFNNDNFVVVKAIDGENVVPFSTTGSITFEFSENYSHPSPKVTEVPHKITIDVDNTAPIINANTYPVSRKNESFEIQNKENVFSRKIRLPETGDEIFLKFSDGSMSKVELGEKLSSGGEGNIYAIAEGYKSMVIKMYRADNLTQQKTNKLDAMVDASAILENEFEDNFFKEICWPRALVYDFDKKHIIGYIMEKVDNGITVEDYLLEIQNTGFSKNMPWNKRSHLVEICIQIAVQFKQLHGILNKKVLMGDINPKNILLTQNNDGSPKVHFIDVDSYQFGEEFPCPVGTPDYSSPRIHKELKQSKSYSDFPRTYSDELFAMSVLFFYILSVNEYPFDVNGKTKISDSIINGNYSYYKHMSGESGAKKSRRNTIYQNFSQSLQELFKNIFKEQKYNNYNDSECIYALQKMSEDISGGRLSNELFPNCALKYPNDKFVTVRCKESDCDHEFESSFFEILCPACKKESEKNQIICHSEDCKNECKLTIDKYNKSAFVILNKVSCLDCKAKIAFEKSRCFKITCVGCNQIFTANLFDLKKNKFNFDSPLCPDCNPDIRYSKKAELEETFDKKIKDNMSYAFKNYFNWRKENEYI